MPKVYVVDREGVEHELEGQPGWSLMEIIREAGLPIEAACGGCCACATCHVYVDAEWLGRLEEPGEEENAMLDSAFEVRETSRLACQIRFRPELAGIRVTLAPEF
ncbi:Ferredoxin-6 [bacterium HR40]|nr:Ferredoxin-6 [bacterium HR40]